MKMSKLYLAVFVILALISSITIHTLEIDSDYLLEVTASVEGNRRVDFSVPERETGKSYLTFFAIGDSGTGKDAQKDVAISMAKVAAQEPISFILLLGDNFYAGGVDSVNDEQWRLKFEDVYTGKNLDIPFYAILGNHDYRKNPQAQVDYTFRSRRWKMPEKYYTFTERVDATTTAQFFMLNTTPLTGTHYEQSGYEERMLAWFEQELQKSKATWKIVAGHHPVYSNGRHGNTPEMIAKVKPLLEKYGVHLYLCGHDHSLQLIKPVGGVHYIVSGGGGKSTSVKWKENTTFAATHRGFVKIRLSSNDLVTEFYDRTGIISYADYLVRK